MAMGMDLIDWVKCWTPLPKRLEVAPMGVQHERGALGPEDAWVARRPTPNGCEYAVVWVADGHLRGERGHRAAENPRDPMVDHRAILAVVRWRTRAEVLAELAAA